MTVSQLKEVMKYHLDNFNDEGVDINDNTIHSEVLSDSDGFTSPSSSKAVYKSCIRWSISKSGVEDKNWPKEWMDLNVDELSSRLLDS